MPTPHLMTAQYVDELVYKQPGLAVVDRDGDTWGWVIDRHKGETGWVVGDTHDDRMQALRDGARVQPQLPAECEKYEFTEENPYTTCAATYPTPTPDDADDDWSDCEPHTGFTVEKHLYTIPKPNGEFTDHMHVPVNDPVNPNHYQGFSNGAEVIDIAENLTFSAGNAVKYLSRAGRIDGQNKGAILEDLRKAAWYVAREIERIEAQK